MKDKIFAAGTLSVLIFLLACTSTSSESIESAIQNKPNHHTSSGFKNDPFVETAASKGMLFYIRRAWSSVFVPNVPAGHALPEIEAMQLLKSIDADRITWLGHASFLVTASGVTILTDPFLTKFASPVAWAGPKRLVDPGIPLDKLPPIDIVVVSHNHYDHLDDKTVRSLKNKNAIHVVVPLGLKAFFTERGYSKVTELDWGESISIGNVTLTSLPAVHDSARSTSDRDRTLWASWFIESRERKIIFIGDTGYSDTIFNRIGKKFGAFDYAILPIGAYAPRKLMWMSHVTPEEAVSIGSDIGAKTLVASHWGTVSSLSDEPPWEPPTRFKKAGLDSGFTEENLWVMKIGETRPLAPNKKGQ